MAFKIRAIAILGMAVVALLLVAQWVVIKLAMNPIQSDLQGISGHISKDLEAKEPRSNNLSKFIFSA